MKVQRTLNWVLSQDSDSGSGSGGSGHSTPDPGHVSQLRPGASDKENNVNTLDTSLPPPVSKPYTMPASSLNTGLDSVWGESGECYNYLSKGIN